MRETIARAVVAMAAFAAGWFIGRLAAAAAESDRKRQREMYESFERLQNKVLNSMEVKNGDVLGGGRGQDGRKA